MEGATTKELRGTIELLDTIERQDIDYDAVAAETPDHITPAHDGMQITYQI